LYLERGSTKTEERPGRSRRFVRDAQKKEKNGKRRTLPGEKMRFPWNAFAKNLGRRATLGGGGEET